MIQNGVYRSVMVLAAFIFLNCIGCSKENKTNQTPQTSMIMDFDIYDQIVSYKATANGQFEFVSSTLTMGMTIVNEKTGESKFAGPITQTIDRSRIKGLYAIKLQPVPNKPGTANLTTDIDTVDVETGFRLKYQNYFEVESRGLDWVRELEAGQTVELTPTELGKRQELAFAQQMMKNSLEEIRKSTGHNASIQLLNLEQSPSTIQASSLGLIYSNKHSHIKARLIIY